MSKTNAVQSNAGLKSLQVSWQKRYEKLSEEGKIYSGDKKTTTINVNKEDGLIGVEFIEGGVAGKSYQLKNYSKSLPPENGVNGTIVSRDGDMVKKVFFFNPSCPYIRPGKNSYTFEELIMGKVYQEKNLTINVTE